MPTDGTSIMVKNLPTVQGNLGSIPGSHHYMHNYKYMMMKSHLELDFVLFADTSIKIYDHLLCICAFVKSEK